jgi:hypothetical protein
LEIPAPNRPSRFIFESRNVAMISMTSTPAIGQLPSLSR